MIQVVPVGREWVDKVWEDVAPLLEKPLSKSLGEFSIGDIHAELLAGEMQLLMIMDETLIAAVVTQIFCYPQKKIFRVILAGGSRMEDWLEATVEMVIEGARNIGADSIEIWGRPGWEKVLNRYNLKQYYRVFSAEVPR